MLLGYNVFSSLGDGGLVAGISHVIETAEPKSLVLIPRGSAGEFMKWSSVLAVSAIGNLPGQDLGQRIFSANSPTTARRACFLAGGLYILLGTIPVIFLRNYWMTGTAVFCVGLGFSIVWPTIVAIVGRRFPEDSGPALSLCIGAGGLGSLCGAPIVGRMTAWTGSFRVGLAMPSLIVILSVLLFWRHSKLRSLG